MKKTMTITALQCSLHIEDHNVQTGNQIPHLEGHLAQSGQNLQINAQSLVIEDQELLTVEEKLQLSGERLQIAAQRLQAAAVNLRTEVHGLSAAVRILKEKEQGAGNSEWQVGFDINRKLLE